MSFTAKDVAKLREMTGAGMMDCKKALESSNGNMDEAVNFLRQKGIATAAKKAGNIAAEGVLAALVAPDKTSAVIIEVNSQTDFVAKNDEFKAFVKAVALTALNNKTRNIEALKKADIGGKTVEQGATELTAKIGEKIDVRRVTLVEGGAVYAYVHPVGSKVGTVVALSQADDAKGADIAMHIAASVPAPEYIAKTEIPQDEFEKEKAIEAQKDDLKGKPAEIIEKIVSGRVDKLLAAKVLLEQPFIKDPGQKVSAYLGNINVQGFVRFNLGEGIEKKESNFADEVAAMMST